MKVFSSLLVSAREFIQRINSRHISYATFPEINDHLVGIFSNIKFLIKGCYRPKDANLAESFNLVEKL